MEELKRNLVDQAIEAEQKINDIIKKISDNAYAFDHGLLRQDQKLYRECFKVDTEHLMKLLALEVD